MIADAVSGGNSVTLRTHTSGVTMTASRLPDLRLDRRPVRGHHRPMTSMVAIAIPYVSVRFGVAGIQIYGCLMFLALTAASVTAALTHRRFALEIKDVAIL